MAMGKRAWVAAASLSIAVHLGAVYFTLAKKPEIELAGGGERQSVVIGSAAFNTIQAGSVPNVEASRAMDISEPVAVDVAEPVEVPPPHQDPNPVKISEPVPVKPNAAQEVQTLQPVPHTVTAPAQGLALEPAHPLLAHAKTTATPSEILPAAPDTAAPATQAETRPLQTARQPSKPMEPIDVLKPTPVTEAKSTAVSEQTPAKVEPRKPLEARRAVQEAVQTDASLAAAAPKETIEAVAEVPVPRTRPKDRPRKVAKAEPRKPKKAKKKRDRESKAAAAGAGGKAGQTAQKGGSRNRAKGKSAGNSNVTNYPALVQRKLIRAKRSVGIRGRRGANRDAVVAFVVKASGAVSSIRLVRSSGSAQLDKAALAAVRKAAPFPKIPAAAGRTSWPFTVPIGF